MDLITTTRILWRTADRSLPRRRPGDARNRARLVAAGLAHRGRVVRMLEAPPDGALGRVLAERPETLGVLIWPYLCAGWGVAERLDRMTAHYAEIDQLGLPFPFSIDQRLVLADLDALYPGLRIVLDQPRWLMREGVLSVNLFVGSFRAFSIAFAPERAADGRRRVLIGGVQGRNREGVTDLYRDLTKAAHGLRPRDFTLELVRILCRYMQADTLLGVSEAMRHHRHPYFGKTQFPQDYDAIWQDRGGVPDGPEFYRLSATPERRDMDTLKAKKRSLYRRRYAFLDALEAQVLADLPGLVPVCFPDS
ncbi:uncharacterized protein Ga0609869_003589 [Rhodovulum iodosum]|uniref:DUF535 domain-containing protein n=1 Tax=Rhodovulum iodosum TaxID=68291 RepID=A0ABV3XXY3_9RHOB|nr:DUF535 family protein [Rhodovulum robiginosum]RSK38869.1 DUF535 domain-containing protein [Rhodovulum robiginosum]